MQNEKSQNVQAVKPAFPVEIAVKLSLFTVFAVAFYLLPHVQTEAMLIHNSIAESLVAGNNWGRQALVGNVYYPAFQTLCLTLSNALAEMFHLNGMRLLCAVAQSMFILFFMRPFINGRKWLHCVIPLAAIALIPVVRGEFARLDPDWVVAVPAASFVVRLIGWKQDRRLVDIIMASVECGVLCLCGLTPAMLGVACALALFFVAKPIMITDGKSVQGMRTLLWATSAYCIALWFLWNWLVMDDVFFGLRDICQRSSLFMSAGFKAHIGYNSRLLIILAAFLAPLMILSTKSDSAFISKTLVVQTFILAFGLVFSTMIQCPQTGIVPLVSACITAVFVLAFSSEFKSPVPRKSCWMSLVVCIFISMKAVALFGSYMKMPSIASVPPSRDEITGIIDVNWPMSRTMLYGVKLPGLFPDAKEERFVARLDFQESDLIVQANDELIHILVPPVTAEYCPSNEHFFAQIHNGEKPYLLLEKQWPNGWQLWRSVITPASEKKLEFLY